MDLVNAARPNPIPVKITVKNHHPCRFSRGADSLPGNSGGNPIAGAKLNTVKPARPQSSPLYQGILLPLFDAKMKNTKSRRLGCYYGWSV